MKPIPPVAVEQIAATCYGACRSYCQTQEELDRPTWEILPVLLKNHFRECVRVVLADPAVSTQAMHDAWCESVTEQGWSYGPEYSYTGKEHSWLLPYDELPPRLRMQYELTRALIETFRPYCH